MGTVVDGYEDIRNRRSVEEEDDRSRCAEVAAMQAESPYGRWVTLRKSVGVAATVAP